MSLGSQVYKIQNLHYIRLYEEVVSDDLIEVVVFDFVVRKLLVEQPIDQMLLDLLDWLLGHEVFDLNEVFI